MTMEWIEPDLIARIEELSPAQDLTRQQFIDKILREELMPVDHFAVDEPV